MDPSVAFGSIHFNSSWWDFSLGGNKVKSCAGLYLGLDGCVEACFPNLFACHVLIDHAGSGVLVLGSCRKSVWTHSLAVESTSAFVFFFGVCCSAALSSLLLLYYEDWLVLAAFSMLVVPGFGVFSLFWLGA